MSSESISTAIILITVLISAGIFFSAFIPAIMDSSSTQIESASLESERLLTDLTVTMTHAKDGEGTAYIWLKNSGILRLNTASIEQSDIFAGTVSDFERLEYQKSGELGNGKWRYEIISPDTPNDYLDRKETLLITLKSTKLPNAGGSAYFRTVLANGYEITKLFEVLENV